MARGTGSVTARYSYHGLTGKQRLAAALTFAGSGAQKGHHDDPLHSGTARLQPASHAHRWHPFQAARVAADV